LDHAEEGYPSFPAQWHRSELPVARAQTRPGARRSKWERARYERPGTAFDKLAWFGTEIDAGVLAHVIVGSGHWNDLRSGLRPMMISCCRLLFTKKRCTYRGNQVSEKCN
jgi:hypothetical protein